MLLKQQNEGFILLEIIVVITIISIGLMPFISYFSNTLFFLHKSEKESQAYKLANTTMEIFKKEVVYDWSNLETIASNFTINNISTNNDLFTDDYNINVNLSGFDFDGDGDIDSDDSEIGRKINIQVSWDNDSDNIQLDSLLRRR